jgi:small neutral amino acid transporter SnatA (MarC family)
MDTKTIDFDVVVELFFLLLIGIGPKIALVPFLDVTAGMDAATKGLVIRKMLTTASVVAGILVVFGELLTRLLHFSTGALAVAGGVVLLIIAVSMVLGLGDGAKAQTPVTEKEPMKLAVFPLAIPYLLNPVGIVVLVTVSAEAASIARVGLVIGVLAFVLALDVVVFRWANKVSERLDESRMLVTEKVFGFLLAALAVELVLTGLDSVGVIHLTGH